MDLFLQDSGAEEPPFYYISFIFRLMVVGPLSVTPPVPLLWSMDVNAQLPCDFTDTVPVAVAAVLLTIRTTAGTFRTSETKWFWVRFLCCVCCCQMVAANMNCSHSSVQ